MAKKCKTCSGRGRWQDREHSADGTAQYQWYECNDCKGTGVDQDPEAGDDFDIGGDSYAED